ncbi:hypothetical protein M8C21_007829 [Ambrosia artemisiifolia]|uniref:Uncharacterized protein n=1 Tax=Ambrosia artemisiifolia TaxID=4212 RepID=A0AAD5CMS9_AMBAR|nr:hypothetical protein M8C21_007829 [Ambrosia artemisiifolia]
MFLGLLLLKILRRLFDRQSNKIPTESPWLHSTPTEGRFNIPKVDLSVGINVIKEVN